MQLVRARLEAPAARLAAIADFYAGLGLEVAQTPAGVAATVGESRLEFAAGDGEPFYHFALLAPGDRFDALLDWIGARAKLLPDRESGSVVFDFESWDAQACYFHDESGNIVELIAHGGVGESGAAGPFAASELLGLSEIGLVGEKGALARRAEELGCEIWSGAVEGEGLAFAGERARTLILCPPGRPWLPTGRPAEPHPVEIAVRG